MSVNGTANRTSVDINLCAGAGGMALGLAQAGFASIEFYDKDRDACVTLRHNLRTDPLTLSGRVKEGDLSQVEWLPNGGPVRLLAVGAPCQPFSMGGSRRGHEDERNLFPIILEAVRILRPRVVLIENVRGLGGRKHNPYLEYILSQLRYPDLTPEKDEHWEDHARRLRQHDTDRKAHITYRVQQAIFNAADFGVPQIRYRLFIVATEVDLPEYKFPAPTHSKRILLLEQATGVYWKKRGLRAPDDLAYPQGGLGDDDNRLAWITVRDALNDLPLPASEENSECNNHWSIPGARAYPGHTGSHLDWPSKTLKAGAHGVPGGENMMVRNDGTVQYYTLREMARIQSFPDSHYFAGARSSVIRQIGNAVPCELAFRVASPLRRLIDDRSPGQKVRQHNMPPPSEADGLDLTREPRLQPMHSLAFGRLV